MSKQNNTIGAETGMKQYTVVVVDDELNALQALKRCFRREPFQIVCAGSGGEGLKLITQTPDVAVIISDQRMPEMNGSEFLARSRELAPDAIRILLTGYSDMDTTITAMNEGGATHFIVKQKPWDDTDLLQTVQKCVWDYHQIESDRTLHSIINRKNEELRELLCQLTEKNIRLKDAKEYAEGIVENEHEPLLVLSSDLKILTANHSFYDTFKVTPENTIGNFIYDLGNRQWNIPKLRILLDEILPLQTVISGYEVEYDFPGIGHKIILLNARLIIRDKTGSNIILLSMDDITARKQIEAELSENQKQLRSFIDQLENRVTEEVGKNREKDSLLQHQDKMSSLGQLAAGVAHEINSPMGYIISNLASLSKYVDKLTTYLDATEHYFAGSDSGTREYLAQERKKYKIDRIRQDLPELISESCEGAERVRTIVLDLKNFSRLGNSAISVFSDINKGLESTLSIAWNELKYKATVTREFGQLPHVWCNIGQLNQVFLNILVNAAHAIEGQGKIRIATRVEAESVKIAISDSGGGIAPEDVKRIFDPFFTTKEVGKGTGLGLAIAYDIVVNKHGGIIDVKSEIGTGTTFTITLPVKRENVE